MFAEYFVWVHAPRFDHELELLDFIEFSLWSDAQAAGSVEVAEVLDALHADIVVCADGVAHHVLNVVGGYGADRS